MKLTSIAAHLSMPALLAVGGFVMALRRESFGIDTFAAVFVGGYLVYAAPHLWWTLVAGLGHFSDAMWHAGYVASSIAIAAIAAFWFFPGDRTGLPMQWLLYWPLAMVLQLVVAGLTAIFRGVYAAKNIMNPMPTTSAGEAGQ